MFIAQLLVEMSNIQWDNICLSETKTIDGNYTLGNGHRLFSGRDEFKYARVVILVHIRWTSSIIHFQKVSNRIVYVDLLLHDAKYKITRYCTARWIRTSIFR